jgi:hypothetical protein
MRNLTNPAWIKLKGALFLLLGLLSSALIFLQRRTLQDCLLLIIAIWAFCRFYYFAFYVIEHYVDPSFRFTGLLSFARYLLHRRPTKDDAS